MTDPIDPNPAPPPYAPPSYTPPPPYAPQSAPGAYPPPYAAQPPAGAYPPPDAGAYPPYGYPWAPPPPPSHTRRNALIAVAAVVVLVAGGLGAYFAFRGSGSSSRLSLPASFGGFSVEKDATSSRVEGMMRGMGSGAGGAAKTLFDAATIGMYQRDADVTSKLIVFAVPTAKVPRDEGGSPSDITAGLMQFAGSTVPERTPGPHGGSSRCGTTSVGAVDETACAWSDSATTGMLVSIGTPLSSDRLSAVELALREQLD